MPQITAWRLCIFFSFSHLFRFRKLKTLRKNFDVEKLITYYYNQLYGVRQKIVFDSLYHSRSVYMYVLGVWCEYFLHCAHHDIQFIPE